MPMFIRSALFALGALFAFGAVAQPGPDQGPPGDASDQPDPPSRVARLSFIRGAVSFVPAGENDWVEAQLNRPLITGDKLYTDRGARAELEIGSAALRIDEGTTFDFLNLDDQNAQVELTEGALNVRVRRLYDNQVYEVDTPTLAFVIDRIGEYRIDVQPNGEGTIVSVVRGSGDAYGEGGARFRVEEGQSVTFHDSQLRDYEDEALPRPDAFDEFIAQRDGRWDHARSRQYVSEDVIGYEDLDDNGEWSDVPEYGHVWYPTTVDIGWSPYHYGHWGWVGAYGWTWIDNAPWGFAPFHYGRWAFVGNRWGWCPGPIAVRPYYAPALVAFIGGGGVGVSISLGGPIGWFPLGPRDVYFPGYHVSRRYFTDVNISNTVVNTTIINNYYGGYARGTLNYGEIGFHNRQVAGAVVAVPAAAFVSARPVHTAAIAVNRDTFANARVSSFAPVAPTRQSLAGPGARAAHVPPPTALNRPIVAASKPPPPVASFAAREAVLQKNPGRPLGMHEMRAAATVQQPGGRVQQPGAGRAAAVGGPANVKVVTNTGAPLRTPAAPLVSRKAADAGARGAGDNRRAAGSATGPANAGGPARGQPNESRAAAGREPGPGRAARDTGAANPRAAQGNAPNEHLQSSRFAHGSDAGNAAASERGNRDVRQQRGQQNNLDAGRGAAERGAGRAASGERQLPANAGRPADTGAAANASAERNARDNAARRGNAENVRGAADNTVRGNADAGRGNAARGASDERVLRSTPAQPSPGGQGRGSERSNAVDRSAQQDRTPQYRENARRAAPQPEMQRVQPPPQQPQYQRAPPPQRVEQPAQNRQPPPQRVEPPQPQYRQPQPQRVEQPAPQYRQPPQQQQQPRAQPQPQGRAQDQRDKRKKDEDKNNGGGR